MNGGLDWLPFIPVPSEEAASAARRRQASLTKPPGSLGRLEEIATWYASITGEPTPPPPDRVIFVVAADHGVAQRGVSAYPPGVTAQMLANFQRGGAAVNVLAALAGARVVVVDAGVTKPVPDVLDRRIAAGTRDFTSGPAMSTAEAIRAIGNGIELTSGLRAGTLVAAGEMGIGNTTSAAALTAVFCDLPARVVTGRGTGIDDTRLATKIDAIKAALAVNEPSPAAPLEALAKVGGFEVATLAGIMIGAAALRCAVILDGFISTAAALVAVALAPRLAPYLIASHRSPEPGHEAALTHLGLEPLLDLKLRLGEGSGAALAVFLIEAARALLTGMATFEEAGVSDSADVVRPDL